MAPVYLQEKRRFILGTRNFSMIKRATFLRRISLYRFATRLPMPLPNWIVMIFCFTIHVLLQWRRLLLIYVISINGLYKSYRLSDSTGELKGIYDLLIATRGKTRGCSENPEPKLTDRLEPHESSPQSANEEQIMSLRHAGFDDRAILDATLIIAYFNFVNRLTLAYGLEIKAGETKGFKY